MNRLWVRFSLVITGVVLFMIALPAFYRLGIELGLVSAPEFVSELPEIREMLHTLPPPTVVRLREAAQQDALTLLTRAIVIAAGLGIVVGAWLSRSLTAPLQKLEEGAQAIAAQELNHRVPVQGSRELRSLAFGFNQMAAQLEQAETLRRNLLADVAHELRHPIHILQGNLQAILDDVYPLNKEEIARLSDQTRHLTALVNDLHELAQAEARQLPLNKQQTDMAQLVKETAASFKPIAAAKKVQLQVELLGALPPLEVDAARMRQVIRNLLHNALRHTPEDGRVTVTVEQKGEALHVQVKDTGAGIKPEDLPRVFDRFYRTDSARSRDTGGAGLGLAIARAIVEAHGGLVTAVSPGLDQGSVITVILPPNTLPTPPPIHRPAD